MDLNLGNLGDLGSQSDNEDEVATNDPMIQKALEASKATTQSESAQSEASDSSSSVSESSVESSSDSSQSSSSNSISSNEASIASTITISDLNNNEVTPQPKTPFDKYASKQDKENKDHSNESTQPSSTASMSPSASSNIIDSDSSLKSMEAHGVKLIMKAKWLKTFGVKSNHDPIDRAKLNSMEAITKNKPSKASVNPTYNNYVKSVSPDVKSYAKSVGNSLNNVFYSIMASKTGLNLANESAKAKIQKNKSDSNN